MATLKDVAKLACVDVSTASRAINNTSYVHPATKKRIIDAVKELGYTPSLVKSILKKGKYRTLAVVVPNSNLTIFSDIIKSIKSETKEREYSIIVGETQNDPDEELELLNRLRNGFIDGMIIAATGDNKTVIKDMEVSGIKVVQILRNDIKTIPSVTANFYSSGYNAVDFLYNQGCMNIGFINGPNHLKPYYERYQGYHDSIVERKMDEIINSSVNLESNLLSQGFEITKQLLYRFSKLDSMIVSLDLLGLGAMRAAKLFNKTIPKDFKLITLTGQSFTGFLETNITSFEIPANDIGKKATEMVIDAIEKTKESKTPLKKVVLDTKLTIYQTT